MIEKYKGYLSEKGNITHKLIQEEAGSAPRIPNDEEYWKKLGKTGKKVMLYFHDDLDGIFSAVAIKKYLLSKDFEIIGYGVVNYQEGWDVVDLNNQYINVAVDFAEITDGIDIYIDHHGDFKEDDDLTGKHAVKTKTYSAYEGIMDQLGLPVDSMVMDVINMVDAAKYDDFGVKWTDLLEWDYDYFKTHKNPKLMFAGVFNQLLKRGDYRTFIEVVDNATEPSIYQIYRLFKLLYPMNNLDWRTMKNIRNYDTEANEYTIWNQFNAGSLDDQITDKDGNIKDIFADFLSDGSWRLDQMMKRTSGSAEFKGVIRSQRDLVDDFTEVVSFAETSRSKFAGQSAEVIKLDGYVIIGDMAFVPSGTWANAIRARSIIEKDINSGRLKGVKKEDVLWVLLQYGDTLQMCAFGDINDYGDDILPQTKEGKPINNLKEYTNDLLKRFKDKLGFNNEDTLSGGHPGIGTISNIGVSRYFYEGDSGKLNRINNLRYLDLFKNYIIANLSQIPWDISLPWENQFKADSAEVPVPKNARVMMQNQIREVDINKSKELSFPVGYEHKPNLGDLKRHATTLKAEQEQLVKDRTEQSVSRAQAKQNYYANKDKTDPTTFEEWEEEQKEK